MILITGATGFLGQRVVKSLLERKQDKVRCFVRETTSDDYFEPLIKEAGGGELELFKGNFNNIADLEKALKGVDSVIHLASVKAGSVPVQIANNVVLSENLFQVCKTSNIKRFLLCSSLGVIKASEMKKGAVIDEHCQIDDKPELRDPYSHSKIVQENLAWQYYEKEKLPLVVVRPSVIFGPPDSILTPRVGLNLFGFFFHMGGSNVLPLTYKDNCADAIVEASYKSGIEGEVFHITDDNLPTSKEVLQLYKQNVKPINTIPFPHFLLKQASRVNHWYSKRTNDHIPPVFTPYKVDTMWKGHKYSNAKAKELLGWLPKIEMREALELTLQYEVKNNK